MQIIVEIVCSLWALQQSLNSRSSRGCGWSWSWVHPSPPQSPPPICLKPQTYPLFAPTLCWGIWAQSLASPTRISACPSPLQRDVGCSSLLDKGFRGTQEVGGPGGVSRKWAMTYVCHGPFSLIFPASNKLTQPVSLKWQVVTEKKVATTTVAETTQWRQLP